MELSPVKASPHYSLLELMDLIEQTVNKTFNNNVFWVKAEITSFTIAPKGYARIELIEKDPNSSENLAQVKAYIWAKNFLNIRENFFKETGIPIGKDLKILCKASVNFSKKYGIGLEIVEIDSNYSLGEAERSKRQTINQLLTEGVFDKNKQLELPQIPQRISIISARDSKGVEDFLNKLRSNPYGYDFYITFYEAKLAGELAAQEIRNRIIEIYNLRETRPVDCIVIVRGGGAFMECFNDLQLSRAIAKVPIPVLTGIGHTTNKSVCDMVAYKDFITPTDAATFLIETVLTFDADVTDTFNQIAHHTASLLKDQSNMLERMGNELSRNVKSVVYSQHTYLSQLSFKISQLSTYLINQQKSFISLTTNKLIQLSKESIHSQKLVFSIKHNNLLSLIKSKLVESNQLLEIQETKINLLNPENLLKKGYSIIKQNNKIIKSAKNIILTQEIELQFEEDTLTAQPIKIKSK